MPEGRAGGVPSWVPPAGVLGVAVASCSAYDVAPPAAAELLILPYALCLLLAPALLFPWLRRLGASLPAAGAGALCVFAAWLAKEMWQLSAAHPLRETLFYALSPVCVGLFSAALLQMALAEGVLRLRAGRSLTGPALLVAAILALGGAAGLAARGNGGREIFYGYVALHRLVFGG